MTTVVLPRRPRATLSPAPTEESNQTSQPCDPLLGGGVGPIEGRPPGPLWAHQGYRRFPPSVAIEVTQEGAKVNVAYDPGCDADHNSGVPGGTVCRPCFHPQLPDQDVRAFWTFNGSLPPKLMVGRYGEGILFRHHNRLPLARTTRQGNPSTARRARDSDAE